MTPPRPRAEWKPGAAFAEFAETLGIPTDHIMGATRNSRGEWTVLWSGDDVNPGGRDAPVKRGILRRDDDGILRLVHLPENAGVVGDYLPRDDIEKTLRDKLGPPDA